uniref:(northern house mosquito) hypothetical protein n=1 Tax=Culex pipiens TaxID=7175 RepID=A0A8D8G3C3_CULPI
MYSRLRKLGKREREGTRGSSKNRSVLPSAYLGRAWVQMLSSRFLLMMAPSRCSSRMLSRSIFSLRSRSFCSFFNFCVMWARSGGGWKSIAGPAVSTLIRWL